MDTSPLIHIGYHKTGTTWLQQDLFGEPTLFGFGPMAPQAVIDEAFIGGNPFTFDPKHARDLVMPSIAEAESIGNVPVISHEPLCGLPTLNGFDSKTIADRLHATFPNARILIAIREQRSMMLSVYKQYVATSGTNSLKRMWREYAPEERRRPFPGLDVFEYHHLIAYYQELFGRDHVLVLPFEHLTQDATAFAARIYGFVGREPVAAAPTTKRNVSAPGILITGLRWSNLVLRAFGMTGPFGGPITRESLRYARYRWIERLNPRIPRVMTKRSDTRMRATIDELASGRFAESNRITSEITGLDLGALGYDVQ